MIFNLGAGGVNKAEQLEYDNSKSGLKSDNVQGAIDEVTESLGDIMAVGNSTYNSVEKLLQYYIDKGYLPSLNDIPLVPKMTSDTCSKGQTISSTVHSTNYAWKGFNQSSSDFFNSQANGAYLGFKFNNPVCVKSFKYVSKGPSWSIVSGKIQASNNGTNWVDLTDTITFTTFESTTEAANYSGKVNNNNGYLYYRLLAVTKDVNASVMELQFYGYEM